MTEEIQGIVKKTIFSSKDGRFCVFLIEEKESGKTVTVSLNSELPYIGQHVLLRGCWFKHPRFGLQFKAQQMQAFVPEKSEEIRKYLSSGVIAGIGPAMADKIVDFFGDKTLKIFENNIDALLDVPGIGPKSLKKIKKRRNHVKNQDQRPRGAPRRQRCADPAFSALSGKVQNDPVSGPVLCSADHPV